MLAEIFMLRLEAAVHAAQEAANARFVPLGSLPGFSKGGQGIETPAQVFSPPPVTK